MGPKNRNMDIQEQLQDIKISILKRIEAMEDNITALFTEFKAIKQTATEAKQLANDAVEHSNFIEAKLSCEIKESIAILQKKHEELEYRLDDQVNRGMRETLVFKGIDGKEGTWSDTANKLAHVISSMDEITTLEDVKTWIDRAHRAKERSDPDRQIQNRSPNIIAKFCSWKLAERTKSIIINYNKNNTTNTYKNVYVEQLQSKLLMGRNNDAKVFRKDIKQKNPEWKLYVEHPAKLMVKKPGDRVYSVLKEF